MELKGKKINFLGDSITEGAGTSCEAARFTCVLKDIAGLSEIRNYGIGGTRIARQQTVTNEKHDKNDYERHIFPEPEIRAGDRGG